MCLLIVEDSERLQRTLATAYRNTGCVVDVAGDGEERLGQAREHADHLIVADFRLPTRRCAGRTAGIHGRTGTCSGFPCRWNGL